MDNTQPTSHIRRRLPAVTVTAVVAALLVAACGGSRGPAPGPSVPATAPLTGEPLTDPAVAHRPVVAVKVENSEAARPQAGLEDADVVFEELTEGGITRFVALFHSRVPGQVGPIRSARLVDAELLAAYRALFVVSGSREEVFDRLRQAGVVSTEEDPRVTHRSDERDRPHNLFATGRSLFAFAAKRVGPATPTGWVYARQPPDGAVPEGPGRERDLGNGIRVVMSELSTTGFVYDSQAGVYRRQQDGTPHPVIGTGQIGAANVVVLATRVGRGGCCDASGAPLTRTDVVGKGRAVVMRDGRRYEVRWRKRSPDDHFALVRRDGRPLALKPGPTWVLLAPPSAVPGPPARAGAARSPTARLG